ncbi:hypothetical protein D9M68_629270 [compost metagenome]
MSPTTSIASVPCRLAIAWLVTASRGGAPSRPWPAYLFDLRPLPKAKFRKGRGRAATDSGLLSSLKILVGLGFVRTGILCNPEIFLSYRSLESGMFHAGQ